MMALNMTSHLRSAAGAAGVAALLFTVGCGRNEPGTVSAQTLTANQHGAPVVVSCEPHQRTLVRQTVVNGAAVSQVECVAAGQPAAYGTNGLAQPVAMTQPLAPPSYAYAPAPQRVYTQLPDTEVVQVAPRRTVRTVSTPVRTRQVVYEERRAPKRSVKKSAIIIGSSAGVGAGVGAAVGGKKGALIGAAIGGGGATIWDQATRRK
jgi:hypothetical protein